jgi:hypothetical protein
VLPQWTTAEAISLASNVYQLGQHLFGSKIRFQFGTKRHSVAPLKAGNNSVKQPACQNARRR